MGKAFFGLVRWGKDASDDDDRPVKRSTMNDVRSEAAKERSWGRKPGIVKDRD